jgi:hypothetical protein
MVTKTTSKRADRKTGAKKKSKTETKRSGAKRRKAPASSPAAEPTAASAPSSKSISTTEKEQRAAFREQARDWPREAWVAHIKDHKQRVLADATASICAIFGIPCDVLRADRKDQSPKSRNENSLRGMALGAVIDTGLTMGLGWNELHTHPEIGRSEVLDLPPHAATIRGAWGRWIATANIDGVLMDVMRARVAEVQAAAVKAAAGGK